MKKIVGFINRFPFAGKVLIKLLVFSFYQSSIAENRRGSYRFVMGVLVFSNLIHGVQTGLGVSALSFDSPIWAKAISAFYTIANVCVILAQTQLGYRINRFFKKGLYPRVKRGYVGYSGAEIVTAYIVTAGGQLIFILQYLFYCE